MPHNHLLLETKKPDRYRMPKSAAKHDRSRQAEEEDAFFS